MKAIERDYFRPDDAVSIHRTGESSIDRELINDIRIRLTAFYS